MDKNQIWPENLTELTIYNSNIDFLPLINNSRIHELTIQSFNNLKTISNIKNTARGLIHIHMEHPVHSKNPSNKKVCQ